MNKTFWNRCFDSYYDNRKSQTCAEPRRSIGNPKWVGIFAIGITFAKKAGREGENCELRAYREEFAGRGLRQ